MRQSFQVRQERSCRRISSTGQFVQSAGWPSRIGSLLSLSDPSLCCLYLCLSSSVVRLTWCRPNVCRQSWQMYEVQLTAPSTADPARKETFAEPHDGHVTPFSSGGRSFFTRFCSITSPHCPAKFNALIPAVPVLLIALDRVLCFLLALVIVAPRALSSLHSSTVCGHPRGSIL